MGDNNICVLLQYWSCFEVGYSVSVSCSSSSPGEILFTQLLEHRQRSVHGRLFFRQEHLEFSLQPDLQEQYTVYEKNIKHNAVFYGFHNVMGGVVNSHEE